LKGDLNAAIAETEKAIAVDSRCDLAYVNLAQMCVNQGKLNEAVNAYEKAVSLSRTILDAENSIMGLEAAKAQMAAIARIK
jgi:import receptor subunit TOM70